LRTLGAALEAHIAQNVTTLATLWKVTRADARSSASPTMTPTSRSAASPMHAATGFTRSAVRASRSASRRQPRAHPARSPRARSPRTTCAPASGTTPRSRPSSSTGPTSRRARCSSEGQARRDPRRAATTSSPSSSASPRISSSRSAALRPRATRISATARCTKSLAAVHVTGAVTSSPRAAPLPIRGACRGRRLLQRRQAHLDDRQQRRLQNGSKGLPQRRRRVRSCSSRCPTPSRSATPIRAIAGCDKTAATCKARFEYVVNYPRLSRSSRARGMASGGL
jgi:hypothetical protein